MKYAPNRRLLCACMILALLLCAMAACHRQSGNGARGEGMATWPPKWYGERRVSCQWSQLFLAHDPRNWNASEGLRYGEDLHVSYFWWSYPKPLPEGTRILIDGDFPHARSMNFQINPPWDPEFPDWRTGEGAPEISMLDEDIAPDEGHVNPFLENADRRAPRRHFHVTFELRSGNPVALNPQAGVPPYRAPGNTRMGGPRSGKDGDQGPYIWYRIYAPDNFDPFGGVSLPLVRIQKPGEEPATAPPVAGLWYNFRQEPQYMVEPYSEQENPCLENGMTAKDLSLKQKRSRLVHELLDRAATDKAIDFGERFKGEDGSLIYYKLFGHPRFTCVMTRGLTMARLICPRLDARRYNRGPEKPPPGNDEHTNGYHVHNTYLISPASLKPGEVLLVRGRAPATPRTLAGDSKMGSSAQLRYWSLCLNYGKPGLLTVNCLMDENVVTDSAGRFTIVLSTDADRPANARPECGITWLRWSTPYSYLVWRYQSTGAKTWEHAPQLVPWEKGDISLDSFDPNAVRNVMGEYFPDTHFVSRQQVESLGCSSTQR